MNNSTETSDVSSQTAGLYINVAVGAATTAVSIILFELLRNRLPTIFDTRRTLHARRSPLDYYNNRIPPPPPMPTSPFAWISPILSQDLESLAETHGLDIALFLRFLRAMIVLFALLHLPALILLPVYYTASNKNLPAGDELRTVGIELFALSNVARDDPWRFWLTLSVDYLVAVTVCLHLHRQFVQYTRLRVRYRAARNPANYAILVQDIPSDCLSDAAVFHYWDRLFPGKVVRAYYIRNAAKIAKKVVKFWKAVSARERAEWDFVNNRKLKGERPMHKPGGVLSCFKGRSARVDTIDFWTQQQTHYAEKIARCQVDKTYAHAHDTRTALVVFSSRRVAAVAAQTNYAERECEWRVSRAPEPNAVNWSALGIPGYQTMLRSSLTILASMALTIFWVIPVTAIMGLTSLQSLARLEINGDQPFKFLEKVAGWPKAVIGFVESFLPAVVLSVFLALVPTFFRLFVSVSRVSSLARVDQQVRDWYFNFVVFSNFLFVIVSGSLFNRLAEIVKQPELLTSFLASSAPKQGAFLMNFVLLKALSETPKEIMQIGRVVVRWFMLKFIAKTQRQRDAADVGNTQFLFFRYYAMSQLIALLGLIYCTISPFIIPCCLAYFVLSYVVWKYNLTYSVYNAYEDGGHMFGGALYAVWTGLFLHLVTMIGLFGLNANPAQSAMIVIPAVGVVAFLLHLRKSYPRLTMHGSSLAVFKRVHEEDVADYISDEVAEKYVHPGMVPLPEDVENLSGVDAAMVRALEKGKEGEEEEEEEDVENGVGRDGSGGVIGKAGSDEEWVDAFSGQEGSGDGVNEATRRGGGGVV